MQYDIRKRFGLTKGTSIVLYPIFEAGFIALRGRWGGELLSHSAAVVNMTLDLPYTFDE